MDGRANGSVDGAEWLSDLYDRHADRVFRRAMQVTRRAAIAEEVTHDVFVELWSKPGSYDPERGSVLGWLLVLAHRRAVERVRNETARRRREERFVVEPTVADAADEAVRALAADELHAAVSALPPRERAVISLAYFDHRSYRDVATMLRLPEGTVKSRVRAGLRRLRDGCEVER